MKSDEVKGRWLIADIGGTNSRLAVWEDSDSRRGRLTSLHKLRNSDYPRIDDMLADYLRRVEGAAPTAAMLAIAGPVTGDEVRLLNIDWGFSVRTLRRALGLTGLTVINDFEALAHVVPVLRDAEQVQVGNGERNATAPSVIIGPGTGLGVASLVPVGNRHVAIPGEGGHASLAAVNEEESRLIDALRRKYGHCSAERVLSGDGLSYIHEAMHGERRAAAEISRGAHEGDAAARATFEQFFLFLGTVAGNVALTLGAMGGVFIGGGIVPSNIGLFRESGFRARFIAKGRYVEYLDRIPTRVITLDTPALIGLSALIKSL